MAYLNVDITKNYDGIIVGEKLFSFISIGKKKINKWIQRAKGPITIEKQSCLYMGSYYVGQKVISN